MTAMQSVTRDVWRAVAASMPIGISSADLSQSLGDKLDPHGVRARLANLQQQGYLSCTQKGRGGLWQTTAKVPRGEQASDATAASKEDVDKANSTDHLWPKRQAPQGVPAGVPNSVFHMGEIAALSADAKPLPTAKAPEPAGAALRTAMQAHGWKPAHPQPAEPPAPPASGAIQPRFELHSDGTFVIDPAGDGTEPIALQATVTRALFRWLDQLGGTNTSRMVEAEPA